MEWTELDTWIVIIGSLCALSGSLLGNFLVLRRMSMMGDAISHAVLPGIAMAFLITQSRDGVPMFVGALAAGLLTTLFTQWVHHFGKVDRGAAMGVVFTTLFAIGLILIRRAGHLDSIDLDPHCVLYGSIETAPLDTIDLGSPDGAYRPFTLYGEPIPRAAVYLGLVLLLNIGCVLLFFKELKISAFDPALATSLGINARLMHYLLMLLVAVTTVASFEAVGSILVIAMLIVPPATAHLLTDRLWPMIAVTGICAVLSAVLGHVAAITLPGMLFEGITDTTTAGMMAVVAGCLFGTALLFAPYHGLLIKVAHQYRLRLRVLREDLLGMLYRLEELQQKPSARGEPSQQLTRSQLREAIDAGPIDWRWAVRGLTRRGSITTDGEALTLTDVGRTAASKLIRSHRLWETYLHQVLALPTDHVHATAERLEHVTTPEMTEVLLKSMDFPKEDPQGKEIPKESTKADGDGDR